MFLTLSLIIGQLLSAMKLVNTQGRGSAKRKSQATACVIRG